MAKIRKFIKGIYQYANLFKISNPTESVGDNEVKQIVPYRGVIQNQGDFITAEDHNEIQKNGVLFVKAEYSENFGTGVDAYVIKNYYNEQNLFDGLKLKFQIPKTNLYAAPVLIIEGLQYNLRAGEESYGITRYGITTDTALEGKRLAEIIGLEFGGNIQDIGVKTTGKFYYDKALKYYYECIVNNSLTYNDGSKFRAISNKPILDKLENLYKVQQAKLYVHSEATGQGRSTCNIVQKCGNVVTIIFDSGDTLRYTSDNTVIFSIPEGYRPKSFLSVNASQVNGTAGTIYIQPDGTAKWRGSTVTTASIIFTVSYII